MEMGDNSNFSFNNDESTLDAFEVDNNTSAQCESMISNSNDSSISNCNDSSNSNQWHAFLKKSVNFGFKHSTSLFRAQPKNSPAKQISPSIKIKKGKFQTKTGTGELKLRKLTVDLKRIPDKIYRFCIKEKYISLSTLQNFENIPKNINKNQNNKQNQFRDVSQIDAVCEISSLIPICMPSKSYENLSGNDMISSHNLNANEEVENDVISSQNLIANKEVGKDVISSQNLNANEEVANDMQQSFEHILQNIKVEREDYDDVLLHNMEENQFQNVSIKLEKEPAYDNCCIKSENSMIYSDFHQEQNASQSMQADSASLSNKTQGTEIVDLQIEIAENMECDTALSFCLSSNVSEKSKSSNSAINNTPLLNSSTVISSNAQSASQQNITIKLEPEDTESDNSCISFASDNLQNSSTMIPTVYPMSFTNSLVTILPNCMASTLEGGIEQPQVYLNSSLLQNSDYSSNFVSSNHDYRSTTGNNILANQNSRGNNSDNLQDKLNTGVETTQSHSVQNSSNMDQSKQSIILLRKEIQSLRRYLLYHICNDIKCPQLKSLGKCLSKEFAIRKLKEYVCALSTVNKQVKSSKSLQSSSIQQLGSNSNYAVHHKPAIINTSQNDVIKTHSNSESANNATITDKSPNVSQNLNNSFRKILPSNKLDSNKNVYSMRKGSKILKVAQFDTNCSLPNVYETSETTTCDNSAIQYFPSISKHQENITAVNIGNLVNQDEDSQTKGSVDVSEDLSHGNIITENKMRKDNDMLGNIECMSINEGKIAIKLPATTQIDCNSQRKTDLSEKLENKDKLFNSQILDENNAIDKSLGKTEDKIQMESIKKSDTESVKKSDTVKKMESIKKSDTESVNRTSIIGSIEQVVNRITEDPLTSKSAIHSSSKLCKLGASSKKLDNPTVIATKKGVSTLGDLFKSMDKAWAATKDPAHFNTFNRTLAKEVEVIEIVVSNSNLVHRSYKTGVDGNLVLPQTALKLPKNRRKISPLPQSISQVKSSPHGEDKIMQMPDKDHTEHLTESSTEQLPTHCVNLDSKNHTNMINDHQYSVNFHALRSQSPMLMEQSIESKTPPSETAQDVNSSPNEKDESFVDKKVTVRNNAPTETCNNVNKCEQFLKSSKNEGLDSCHKDATELENCKTNKNNYKTFESNKCTAFDFKKNEKTYQVKRGRKMKNIPSRSSPAISTWILAPSTNKDVRIVKFAPPCLNGDLMDVISKVKMKATKDRFQMQSNSQMNKKHKKKKKKPDAALMNSNDLKKSELTYSKFFRPGYLKKNESNGNKMGPHTVKVPGNYKKNSDSINITLRKSLRTYESKKICDFQKSEVSEAITCHNSLESIVSSNDSSTPNIHLDDSRIKNFDETSTDNQNSSKLKMKIGTTVDSKDSSKPNIVLHNTTLNSENLLKPYLYDTTIVSEDSPKPKIVPYLYDATIDSDDSSKHSIGRQCSDYTKCKKYGGDLSKPKVHNLKESTRMTLVKRCEKQIKDKYQMNMTRIQNQVIDSITLHDQMGDHTISAKKKMAKHKKLKYINLNKIDNSVALTKKQSVLLSKTVKAPFSKNKSTKS